MSRVNMTAIVSVECEARTLGDLREFVKWCDEYGVKDECDLDWGSGKLFVDLTGDGFLPADWIQCGDHITPDRRFDVIVDLHEHPYKGPETYEEAREEALEKSNADMRERWGRPAKYDWPTIDRIPGGMSDQAIPEYDL